MRNDRRNDGYGMAVVFALVIIGLIIVMGNAGCSTASGFGTMMQGFGRDIQDAAEGTRDRMARDTE